MILKPLNRSEIQGKVREFFHSKRWKNTLTFFCFVALASGFWALQYFRQKFEFEIPVKVYYEHIPAGISLSGKLPQEITLYVQDKGSTYLNYSFKLRKQPLSIAIDLEAIPPSKTSYVIDEPVLYNLINEKLFATTQIKSFSPNRIEINYSLLAQKELPVAINGTVSPASGYQFVDSIRIEPARVVAYGDKKALDTLLSIQTLPLNYTDIDKDWNASTGLQAPEGTHLLIKNVKLSAMIEEYTEKTFKLPVVCYNTPPTRKVHFFPSVVELVVRVGLSKYSQLSESNFEIAVNYNDLVNNSALNCTLTLTRKPTWVENYRISPNVIEFLIEKSD